MNSPFESQFAHKKSQRVTVSTELESSSTPENKGENHASSFPCEPRGVAGNHTSSGLAVDSKPEPATDGLRNRWTKHDFKRLADAINIAINAPYIDMARTIEALSKIANTSGKPENCPEKVR